MHRHPPVIGLVVPCFNEEQVFPHLLQELVDALDRLVAARAIAENSYVCFVDDGSEDQTWCLIDSAHATCPARIRGIKLARNCGHQNALLAGLFAQIGQADATISLDADLQDDVGIIGEMVDRFVRRGCDLVFGVRNARPTDTFLKRVSATGYYRVLRWLGADIIPDHADFRLMSDRAVRALERFGEVHVFLRGLVVQLGYRHDIVYFERGTREHGISKYSLAKMVALAIDGITSFSVRPLRLVTSLGLGMMTLSLVVAVWALAGWMAGKTIQGWTSAMLVFLVVSSFQTLALGVIGEYVGKTYFEAKSRPRFIVEKETHHEGSGVRPVRPRLHAAGQREHQILRG